MKEKQQQLNTKQFRSCKVSNNFLLYVSLRLCSQWVNVLLLMDKVWIVYTNFEMINKKLGN